MEDSSLYLIIAGMAVVTIIPRVFPVGFLAERKMPDWFVAWLKHVPIAILSAMLALDLLWRETSIELSPKVNPMLPAALLGFLVAMRTKNLFATVSAGMGALAILRICIA